MEAPREGRGRDEGHGQRSGYRLKADPQEQARRRKQHHSFRKRQNPHSRKSNWALSPEQGHSWHAQIWAVSWTCLWLGAPRIMAPCASGHGTCLPWGAPTLQGLGGANLTHPCCRVGTWPRPDLMLPPRLLGSEVVGCKFRYLAATLLTWLEKEQAESSSSEMQEHQWLITSFNPNIKSTSWDSFLKELELCVCHLQLKIFSLRCHCATLPRAGRTWQVPEAGSAVWPELQASWGTHRSVWDYQILCWHFFKREAKSIFSITAVIFSFSFCFSSSSHPHSTFWMWWEEVLLVERH